MSAQPHIFRSFWPRWLLLVVFSLIAFESVLLGAALKGPWFILFAPGVVCGVKAFDTWRELRKDIRAMIDAEED